MRRAGPAGGGGVAKLGHCGNDTGRTLTITREVPAPFRGAASPADAAAGRAPCRSARISPERTRPRRRFHSPAGACEEPMLPARLPRRTPVLYARTGRIHTGIRPHAGSKRHGGVSMALQLGDTAPDFEAKRPKAKSGSTTGSAIPGPCCSRTRRISRRSAPPSSATWPRSSPSSTSAASRSSASRSIRSRSTRAGPNDIKETQGFAPNYPMIGDTDLDDLEALRHAAGERRRRRRKAHRRPTTRPCATSSSSAPTRRSS